MFFDLNQNKNFFGRNIMMEWMEEFFTVILMFGLMYIIVVVVLSL